MYQQIASTPGLRSGSLGTSLLKLGRGVLNAKSGVGAFVLMATSPTLRGGSALCSGVTRDWNVDFAFSESDIHAKRQIYMSSMLSYKNEDVDLYPASACVSTSLGAALHNNTPFHFPSF